MTLEQLKKQEENSYLHAPNDGADWRCSECKQLKPYTQMIITFVAPKHDPNRKDNPHWMCLECIDEYWLSRAKDCGTLE